jgi:glycosyltransferase involved in cell wall biosynthesis
MPRLIHISLARDEEYCVEDMLKSVLPYVEASYVLVDDRSRDRTEEILLDYGCIVAKFSFENFGKTNNTLLKWVNDRGDWRLFLPPDELIMGDFGEKMVSVVESLHHTDIDGVHYPRKNWLDLEMTEHNGVYPDWQLRLCRLDFPRIHYVNYVHEIPIGLRKTIHVNEDTHHFCLYWKDKFNKTEEKIDLYRLLQHEQREDIKKGINNIWPD